MKRDLELIRKMVLAIEDSPSSCAPELSFDGYTPEQINYHAYLLIDAGLAQGDEVTVFGSDIPQAEIERLTWPGHEFAEAARNDTRWTKAMGIVQDKGGNITLDVLKQLLITLMKGTFGLP